MDANAIEQNYQEAILGRDEPEWIYLTGRSLKEFQKKLGQVQEVTEDGHPITDSGFYLLTRHGIWLAE